MAIHRRVLLNRVDGKLRVRRLGVKGFLDDCIDCTWVCRAVMIGGGIHYSGKTDIEGLHENVNQRTNMRTPATIHSPILIVYLAILSYRVTTTVYIEQDLSHVTFKRTLLY